MIALIKLLAQAKKLNASCRNVMSREDLQKFIKDTIIKYKETIFSVDAPVSTECLNELQKQQIISEIMYRKKLLEDTVRNLI